MKKWLFLFPLLSYTSFVYSQCNVNANATQYNITCGESVILSHVGSTSGNISFSENFNNGQATGWAFTQQATFSNPCSPNGVDGTTHIWMGDQSGVPRTLETLPLNFGPSVAPAGGTICFDLLFSEQGDSAPCEGPDEPDEGVYLQYSVDGGTTWITINYFDPNGGNDPQLVNWNNWCFPIPNGALVNGVKFRWFQDADSGAAYDHWGIDNVQIIVNDPNVVYTYSHDGYTTSLPGDNPTAVSPNVTTTYIVTMTTSTGSCTANVEVIVTNPDVQVNAGIDLSVCPGQCVDLQGIAKVVNDPGGIKTFSNNQTEDFDASIFGGASVNVNIQDLNMDQVNPGSLQQVCITNLTFSGLGLPPSGVETLSLTLECPDGGTVLLVPSGDAPSGNPGVFGIGAQPSYYQNVCFVPSGGVNITSIADNTPAATPITGSINSNQPFSNLDGCTANGLWSISVSTNALTGSGTFDGWSITFDDEEDSYTPDILWSPTTFMSPGEETTQTPTVCPAVNTTYTLTASDTAGCVTVTDQVNVTTDGVCCALTIDNVAINHASCGVLVGSFTVSYSGETSGLVFSLDGGTTTQTSPTFSNLAPGTYNLYMTDDANCVVTYEVVILGGNGPVLTVTETDVTCGNNDGQLVIQASGGVSPYEYSIDNGTTVQSSNTFTGLGTGTYSILVTDDNGCSTTATGQISNPNAPQITNVTITDEICGQGNGELVITASGGLAPYEYSIDNGVTFSTDATFDALAAGSYAILVQDANNCSVSDQVTVGTLAGPQIDNVSITQADCGQSNGEIEITASGGTNPLTYSIDNGGTNVSSNVFANLTPGVYQIVVEDNNGCTTSQQATITTTTVPNINAGPDQTICAGETVTLTATGGVSYSWDYNVTNGVPFTPSQTSTYSVVGTDANGCQNVDQVQVTVVSNPTASFTATPTTGNYPLVVDFTNTSTGGATNYVWNFDDNSAPISVGTTTGQTNTYTNPGTYIVTLVASNGSCLDSYQDTIFVIGTPLEIHVPNVFTPSGDGINDAFFIDVVGGKSILVEIVNRWGNLVYTMDDFTDKWDGDGYSDGVYFFKYRIEGMNGEILEGHGHVTLIRKE